MDPITQGLLGGAVGFVVARQSLGARAALIGACAGMAPDLDVLISSPEDPTLGWIFHRHFTHALVFIPLGAALTSLFFLTFAYFRERASAVLIAAVAGMATHAALDVMTSYGTLWLWPFSLQRIAFDIIPVVDPIYTLILAVALTVSLRRRTVGAAALGLLLSTGYLGFGAWQHQRALEVQRGLADRRDHQIERGRAIPSLGSLLLWRSIYEFEGRFFVDGIRLPYWGQASVAQGSSVRKVAVDLPRQLSTSALMDSQPAQVLAWFADGWMARPPSQPDVLADFRYALNPDSDLPLWGLRSAQPRDERWNSVGGVDRRALVDLLVSGSEAYQLFESDSSEPQTAE